MVEKFPNYFILNPLTADEKLSRFFFKNPEEGMKYYPKCINGGRTVSNETINDFIKNFFYIWPKGVIEKLI